MAGIGKSPYALFVNAEDVTLEMSEESSKHVVLYKLTRDRQSATGSPRIATVKVAFGTSILPQMPAKTPPKNAPIIASMREPRRPSYPSPYLHPLRVKQLKQRPSG
jgi:hypothetical protein